MSEQKVSKKFKLKAKLNYYLARIFTLSFSFKWLSFMQILNYLNKKIEGYKNFRKNFADDVSEYFGKDNGENKEVWLIGLLVFSFLASFFICFFVPEIIGIENISESFLPRAGASFLLAIVGTTIGTLVLGIMFFALGCFLWFLSFVSYYFLKAMNYPLAVISFVVGNLFYNLFLILKVLGDYLFSLITLIFTSKVESYLQGVILILNKKKEKLNNIFNSPKGKYQAILRLKKETIILIKELKKENYNPIKSKSTLVEVETAIELMDKAKEIVKASTDVLNKLIKEFNESLRLYKLQKREQRVLRNKDFIQQALQEVFDKSFAEFSKFPKLEDQLQVLRKDIFEKINSTSLISDSLDKASEVIRKIDDEHSVLSDVVKI